MEVKNLFIIARSNNSYRMREPAKIVGLSKVTPKGWHERLCYKVMYKDGVIDYIPTSDVEKGVYEMITEDEVFDVLYQKN